MKIPEPSKIQGSRENSIYEKEKNFVVLYDILIHSLDFLNHKSHPFPQLTRSKSH